MYMTITELRKNLFDASDRAIDGQPVTYSHRGHTLRIVADGTPSRLDRLTPIKVLAPSSSFEQAKKQLAREMEAEWEKDWAEL